eukprot:m.191204 g.191204  ORF g.191204 m.191204 type:complete len:404 (+) comp18586_c0_seq1:333-1544(+)
MLVCGSAGAHIRVRSWYVFVCAFSFVSSSSDGSANKYGIGVYTDTPGSPSLSTQLDAAVDLVGPAAPNSSPGWVTLYLCAWRNGPRSCVNRSTTHDPSSSHALDLAYKSGLNVVARLGNPYVVRDHSDDEDHLNYTSLAQAYARLVTSFPAPPNGTPLYVIVGNEFNACNEWRCSGENTSSISRLQMAKEVAAFACDVITAFRHLREFGSSDGNWKAGQVLLANGPIANWDTAPCQCGTGVGLGSGQLGLSFLDLMMASHPRLYAADNVDFLASHPYPFSGATWGTVKAMKGLLYYQNESMEVGRGTAMPVVITETGWRRDSVYNHISDDDRANWTALAFARIWGPDPQVRGVTPFLLAGRFWDDLGWPWMNSTSTGVEPLSIYRQLREARCSNGANAARCPT